MAANAIPRDGSIDSTGAFLRQGYAFIGNRCRGLHSDAFETRLGLEPTICMLGEEAARTFYSAPVTRSGAMPPSVVSLLQDQGSVQALDGPAHRHRKELFVSLLAPGMAREVAEAVDEEWRRRGSRWEQARELVLLREAQELLCAAICRWTGIELGEQETAARTDELTAMIDGAGTFGPRNWRGQLLRRRTERWAARLVRAARASGDEAGADAPLRRIALHRDRQGELLDPAVAAVELINILRPTVAVARYVVFAALSLAADPDLHDALTHGSEEDLKSFVLEVRRFYPLFPVVAGRLTEDFTWRGETLPRGRRVVLDLYGTDHDPRLWDHPDSFDARRFKGWGGNPFTLIPQGGGDHLTGHRCPGEWVTIEALKASVRGLLRLSYRVPPQDLRISLSRMPARPRSGLVISDVRVLNGR